MLELSHEIPPETVPLACQIPEKVWRVMGYKIDWEAMPYLCEIYGVDDPELLLMQLIVIRDYKWPKKRSP